MKTKLLGVCVLALIACKDEKKGEPAKPADPAAKPAEPAAKPAEPAAAVDKVLAENAPLDLGKGVTVTFTKKQTSPGGDNEPPTNKHTVTAKCGGKDVVVLESEHEGGDAKVNVKTAGDQATVVMATHIAREGEIDDLTDTATLDLATCKVTKQ